MSNRVLDFEVAQKIFGWTKHRNTNPECSKVIELSRKLEWEYDWVPKEFNEDWKNFWRSVPEYTSDWNFAHKVIDQIHNLNFSKRKNFTNYLQDLVTNSITKEVPGYKIAWPDVIFHLTPEIICKAALKVIDENPN